MSRVRRLAGRIAWDFAALVVVAVVWHGEFFGPERSPSYDTFQFFLYFHTFLSQLETGGSLPLWLPYADYGLPSLAYQCALLTPSSCGTILLGAVLRIGDSLLLARLAALHEILLYLSGLYLCCGRLGMGRRARFVACLAGLGTVSWPFQIYYDLRMLYLEPLMVWCLLKYRDERIAGWFWAAGLAAVVASIGGPCYFAPLHLLTLTCAGTVLLVRGGRSFLAPLWRPTRSNLLGMAVLAAVSVPFLVAVRHSLKELQQTESKRSEDFGADLETFLTYADFDLGLALRGHFRALPRLPQDEPNLYVGLATWPLLGLALAGRRRREVWIVAVPAAVFAAMALSRTAGTILFYFPLMHFYRHRMYVLSLANVFLILGGGCGLQDLLDDDPRRRNRRTLLGCLLLAALLIVGAAAGGGTLAGGGRPRIVALAILGAILFAAAVLSRAAPRPVLPWAAFAAIVAWFAVDLTLYRQLRAGGFVVPPQNLGLYDVRPLAWVPTRESGTLDIRPGIGVSYSLQRQWENKDMCDRTARSQLCMPPIYRVWTDERISEPVRFRLFGCGSPKLQFTDSVAGVGSWDETISALVRDEARVDVLPADDLPPGFVPGSLRIPVVPAAFDANRVEFEVDAPRDGFVVYKDAYHPDWQATVDGTRSRILVADGCFKAVFVAQGRRRVVLEFGGVDRILAYVAFGVAVVCFLGLNLAWMACLFGPPPPVGEPLGHAGPPPPDRT